MLAKIPAQQPDFRLEMLDDELLLYHPAATKIMYCNATASLVWQLCNGQRSVQEIIALLANAYPEAADSLPADVTAALQQFVDHGAITLA